MLTCYNKATQACIQSNTKQQSYFESFSCTSSSLSRFIFLSPPLAHIAVAWCFLFTALQGTNKHHLGRYGRGWFPSSRTTSFYRTLRCKKQTRSLILIMYLSGNPLNGRMLCYMLTKGRIYNMYWSCPIGGGSLRSPRITQFCTYYLVSKDTAVRPTLHLGYRTRWWSLFR